MVVDGRVAGLVVEVAGDQEVDGGGGGILVEECLVERIGVGGPILPRHVGDPAGPVADQEDQRGAPDLQLRPEDAPGADGDGGFGAGRQAGEDGRVDAAPGVAVAVDQAAIVPFGGQPRIQGVAEQLDGPSGFDLDQGEDVRPSARVLCQQGVGQQVELGG